MLHNNVYLCHLEGSTPRDDKVAGHYLGSEGVEEQVLTPNIVMWGQNSHMLEDGDEEEEELDKVNKRLQMARQLIRMEAMQKRVHSLFHGESSN